MRPTTTDSLLTCSPLSWPHDGIRMAVLPSECHHPAQELEIICGQNLLCLGATEEFHIAARLLLHGIGTQQPGKDGWMRCIDDDQPAQHVGVRNGERPSDEIGRASCRERG